MLVHASCLTKTFGYMCSRDYMYYISKFVSIPNNMSLHILILPPAGNVLLLVMSTDSSTVLVEFKYFGYFHVLTFYFYFTTAIGIGNF